MHRKTYDYDYDDTVQYDHIHQILFLYNYHSLFLFYDSSILLFNIIVCFESWSQQEQISLDTIYLFIECHRMMLFLHFDYYYNGILILWQHILLLCLPLIVLPSLDDNGPSTTSIPTTTPCWKHYCSSIDIVFPSVIIIIIIIVVVVVMSSSHHHHHCCLCLFIYFYSYVTLFITICFFKIGDRRN